jgi:hypothetical protein
MNVSTGEPDGKWKTWVKWIVLLLVSLAAALAAEACEPNVGIALAWATAILLCLWRFPIAAQRFDLLIDQHAVQVNLYTDSFRRTWISWKSRDAAGRSCLGAPYFSGWVNHAIPLGGKQYQLRILIKPVADGYMISNYGRGFEMRVIRHTHAL